MPGLRIHYFQHLPHEDLGSIEGWAQAHGHQTSCTRFFANDPIPPLADIDWLIVMGGSMGVYEHERYPWLRTEWTYIREAIDAGKTVFGICLGAQLIAHALGARVYPGPEKEIGWLPVEKTDAGRSSALLADMPEPFTVLHWHGDTFDLPAGAIWLARSAATANQAFSYGEHVLALQFHLEATEQGVEEFLREDLLLGDKGELTINSTYVQTAATIRAGVKHAEANNRAMSAVLDRLAAVGSPIQ